MTVAALFVETGGIYFGRPDVDPWDEQRDARTYSGPHPVLAHPPCSRWCMPLARVNETRYGHTVGEDGGCFKAALGAVRRYGGVLEHPAHSWAFPAFGLAKPVRAWTGAATLLTSDPGWVCEISQSAYGHRARKRTWLYYCGSGALPTMDWSEHEPTALVSQLTGTTSDLPRLSKREAKATPPAFAELMIDLARSAA